MTTITKTSPKKDLKLAEALMDKYALLAQSREDLLNTIMEELKGYEAGLKETQAELIEIGERNKESFNADGNLMFEKGYLHIANNTVILTKKKFDLAVFAQEKPDLIDITLKVSPIKKAFLDNDMRKELAALGVSVTTEQKVQVILPKKKS